MGERSFCGGFRPAAIRPDAEKRPHNTDTTVKTRREHLSGVLKDLAPDVVVVCEGPSRILVDTDSDDARRDIF